MKQHKMLSISETAAAFRAKRFSPMELLAEMLERIKAYEPELQTFAHLMIDQAQAQARQAEQDFQQGMDRGVLQGIPLSLKDNIALAGFPLTNGSARTPAYISSNDAYVSRKLLDAGAIILGKAQLHEFAYGPHHPRLGSTHNPWNPLHIPGGSSSGSAAGIAAGFALGSIGSDSAGSVRVPAAFCGITGFKPTYGQIPIYGITPLAPSLDHVGILAGSSRDVQHLYDALLDKTFRSNNIWNKKTDIEETSLETTIRGVRVGVDEAYLSSPTDPETSQAIKDALALMRDAGAVIVSFETGLDIEEVKQMTWTILHAEAYQVHHNGLQSWAGGYGPALKANLELGRNMESGKYEAAMRWRNEQRDKVLSIFDKIDIWVSPTCPVTARPYMESSSSTNKAANGEYTPFANLWGLPALSVPAALSESGMPIGLQFTGLPFADHYILSIGCLYDELRGSLNRMVLS